MNSPLVAVVILNWNGRKYLEQFLPSVQSSTYANTQIIVADNASTDDSIDFLKAHYSSVRIIQLEKNYGFAKGYNKALEQVQADYFVLLNSDVEVTPHWLEPMVSLLENDKTIAACQPKLLAYHNKEMFEYAGAAGGWIDRWGYPFAKGRVFEECEKDQGQYDQEEPIFWASGAALFIRTNAYKEMNGLDEFFFAHQEEIDLCWRLQLGGYKIYACPSSVVYHVGGGTLPKGNSLKTFLNFRNNLIMLSKNLPVARKLYVIPLRMGLDVVSAIRALFAKDVGFFKAVFKAHIAYIKWIFMQQHQSIFPTKKKKLSLGIYKGLVIWDYFLIGKKKFSEIVSKTIS